VQYESASERILPLDDHILSFVVADALSYYKPPDRAPALCRHNPRRHAHLQREDARLDRHQPVPTDSTRDRQGHVEGQHQCHERHPHALQRPREARERGDGGARRLAVDEQDHGDHRRRHGEHVQEQEGAEGRRLALQESPARAAAVVPAGHVEPGRERRGRDEHRHHRQAVRRPLHPLHDVAAAPWRQLVLPPRRPELRPVRHQRHHQPHHRERAGGRRRGEEVERRVAVVVHDVGARPALPQQVLHDARRARRHREVERRVPAPVPRVQQQTAQPAALDGNRRHHGRLLLPARGVQEGPAVTVAELAGVRVHPQHLLGHAVVPHSRRDVESRQTGRVLPVHRRRRRGA